MSEVEFTCGQCKHAKMVQQQQNSAPIDLRARTCYGAPPACVLVPTQSGLQMAAIRPNVMVDDRACGMFFKKFELAQ